MRNFSKFGLVAAAVGTAFLAGCAGQGGGTQCGVTPEPAAPAPMPVVQNSCKGQASCKGQTSTHHAKKKHHKAIKTTTTSETTEEAAAK